MPHGKSFNELRWVAIMVLLTLEILLCMWLNCFYTSQYELLKNKPFVTLIEESVVFTC